jgi:hypothetical protein
VARLCPSVEERIDRGGDTIGQCGGALDGLHSAGVAEEALSERGLRLLEEFLLGFEESGIGALLDDLAVEQRIAHLLDADSLDA